MDREPAASPSARLTRAPALNYQHQPPPFHIENKGTQQPGRKLDLENDTRGKPHELVRCETSQVGDDVGASTLPPAGRALETAPASATTALLSSQELPNLGDEDVRQTEKKQQPLVCLEPTKVADDVRDTGLPLAGQRWEPFFVPATAGDINCPRQAYLVRQNIQQAEGKQTLVRRELICRKPAELVDDIDDLDLLPTEQAQKTPIIPATAAVLCRDRQSDVGDENVRRIAKGTFLSQLEYHEPPFFVVDAKDDAGDTSWLPAGHHEPTETYVTPTDGTTNRTLRLAVW